jgi:hypothetical protein
MSTVKANDLTNVTGGIPTVKSQQLIPTAWVNFNGTGTVAIRDSENVSSITDHGAGDYSITWATAMSNGNYAVAHMVNRSNALSRGGQWCTYAVTQGAGNEPTAAALRINTGYHSQGSGGGIEDQQYITLTVMGGQA